MPQMQVAHGLSVEYLVSQIALTHATELAVSVHCLQPSLPTPGVLRYKAHAALVLEVSACFAACRQQHW